MRRRGLVSLLLLAAVSSGCATMTNRGKTLALMGGAALVGGTLGAALAPQGESKMAHAAMWGGVSSAFAGGVGLFAFDEEARRRGAEEKAAKLEREVAAYRDEIEPELIATNRVGAARPLPEKFKHLITPGQWSLYKVDRWISNTENELVHQDLLFRFHQPQLNPSGKPAQTAQSKEDVK